MEVLYVSKIMEMTPLTHRSPRGSSQACGGFPGRYRTMQCELGGSFQAQSSRSPGNHHQARSLIIKDVACKPRAKLKPTALYETVSHPPEAEENCSENKTVPLQTSENPQNVRDRVDPNIYEASGFYIFEI